MRCLFHRWREIACAPGTVSMESVVFRSSAEEQVVSRLYRCHRCGKRKGILTRLDGSKMRVDPEFLRGLEASK